MAEAAEALRRRRPVRGQPMPLADVWQEREAVSQASEERRRPRSEGDENILRLGASVAMYAMTH